VTLSAAAIDPTGAIANPETPTADRQKLLVRADFRAPVRDALRAQFPSVAGRTDKRALDGLLSSGAALQLRRIGARRPVPHRHRAAPVAARRRRRRHVHEGPLYAHRGAA
jgi:hypothetical protein